MRVIQRHHKYSSKRFSLPRTNPAIKYTIKTSILVTTRRHVRHSLIFHWQKNDHRSPHKKRLQTNVHIKRIIPLNPIVLPKRLRKILLSKRPRGVKL